MITRREIRAAVKSASNDFSTVHRISSGHNGWGYLSYSRVHNLWVAPCWGHDYLVALAQRAQDIAGLAAQRLAPDPDDWYGSESYLNIDLYSGTAAERCEQLLAKHRARAKVEG